MKKTLLRVSFLALAAVLGAWWALSGISLSALEEPSTVETYMATRAKRWLIGRAAREVVPPQGQGGTTPRAIGGMQFRADCAACHGSDGRSPTDTGKWMSPRAPDLGWAETQAWSDAELFWIIKHGIRMTGMPGFGRVHPDERIWQIVAYVREIGKQPPPEKKLPEGETLGPGQ